MRTWQELEKGFSYLAPEMRFASLGAHWGAVQEQWHLGGGIDSHNRHRFEALGRLAGRLLITSEVRLHPEVDAEQDPLLRWYKALRFATGLFESGDYYQQVLKSGEPGGFIFSGRIHRPAEASAILCLQLAATETPPETNGSGEKTMPDTRTVFVVHGRDEPLRSDFFTFLRALGLHPLEWSDALRLTEHGSPYIGDVLDAAFNRAQAVVVLLTPDDEVRLHPDLCSPDERPEEQEFRAQARPNVLFEAGMAFGRNGQRTILVEVGHVKGFSDVAGRHLIRLTNAVERRKAVAQRLETAGCTVSMVGDDWLKVGNFSLSRATVAGESNRAAGSQGDSTASNPKQSLAKQSPDLHILRSVALLGEESYSLKDIAQQAREPVLKVDYYLKRLASDKLVKVGVIPGSLMVDGLDLMLYSATPAGVELLIEQGLFDQE